MRHAAAPGYLIIKVQLQPAIDYQVVEQVGDVFSVELAGMDLEFLLRQKPTWRVALKDILFKEGDIVEHGEEAEEDEQKEG